MRRMLVGALMGLGCGGRLQQDDGSGFAIRAAKAIFVLLSALTVCAPTAEARQRLIPLTHSRLGTVPSVVIHDTVLSGRRLHRNVVPSNAYGGVYFTADGAPVTVYMSAAYIPDGSYLQAVANFFDSLYHRDELAAVTIYVAPIDEIHADCMSTDADGCFDPSTDTIYIPGATPPDGTPVEELAAHEYGHLIAHHRLNAWSGDAFDWGPEYWASYENVCARTLEGTAFPGNEGAHYSQNPGEAWADTNRLLNGGNPNVWQFDLSFFPDSTALQNAKKDILQPWSGNVSYSTQGRFRPHQTSSRSYTLDLPDDGPNDSIKLFTHGSLRANLYLYDATGALVGKAQNPGQYEAIRFRICGAARARIGVYRRSGYGSYTLQANIP
jgi:hypothetical protein